MPNYLVQIGQTALKSFIFLFNFNLTLATILDFANVDCALITETWFTTRHLSQYVAIDGYDVFRRDRPKRDGGRVCIYVRNNIDASVVTFTDSPTRFEKIWITFSNGKHEYYAACCYHPPAPRYCSEDLIAEIIDDIDHYVAQ